MKSKNTVAIEDNRIIIIGKKSALAARAFLWFLIAFCSLLPVVVTITQIAIGNGLHFGLFVMFLLFWGMAFILFRAVIWNTYGREIIELSDNTISYTADYKFFKGNQRTFNVEETGFQTDEFFESKNVKNYTLAFKTSDQPFNTALNLDADEFCKIVKELEKRYDKVFG